MSQVSRKRKVHDRGHNSTNSRFACQKRARPAATTAAVPTRVVPTTTRKLRTTSERSRPRRFEVEGEIEDDGGDGEEEMEDGGQQEEHDKADEDYRDEILPKAKRPKTRSRVRKPKPQAPFAGKPSFPSSTVSSSSSSTSTHSSAFHGILRSRPSQVVPQQTSQLNSSSSQQQLSSLLTSSPSIIATTSAPITIVSGVPMKSPQTPQIRSYNEPMLSTTTTSNSSLVPSALVPGLEIHIDPILREKHTPHICRPSPTSITGIPSPTSITGVPSSMKMNGGGATVPVISNGVHHPQLLDHQVPYHHHHHHHPPHNGCTLHNGHPHPQSHSCNHQHLHSCNHPPLHSSNHPQAVSMQITASSSSSSSTSAVLPSQCPSKPAGIVFPQYDNSAKSAPPYVNGHNGSLPTKLPSKAVLKATPNPNGTSNDSSSKTINNTNNSSDDDPKGRAEQPSQKPKRGRFNAAQTHSAEQRKIRKRDREKQRRQNINDEFRHLSKIVKLPASSDRITILTAIRELMDKQNAELGGLRAQLRVYQLEQTTPLERLAALSDETLQHRKEASTPDKS